MQTAVTVMSRWNPICAALFRAEHLLYYQPQVDSSGRMIGAEALRWRNPERGMKSPADFILPRNPPILPWATGDGYRLRATGDLGAAGNGPISLGGECRATFNLPTFVEECCIGRLFGVNPARLS
jgi:hypothetical protein